MRIEPLHLEARHGGETGKEALGLLERHAEPAEPGIDLDIGRSRFARRRARDGFGARPVHDCRHQPGAHEIGHALRQRAGEHDDGRAQPRLAQPAGLVEGAGHERRKPFAVERPRHGRGAVSVGIALERGNDGLAGRAPAADRGEIGQQPVQIVNGPAGMRGFRHSIALPGMRPRPGACSCGFFAISNRRGGP